MAQQRLQARKAPARSRWARRWMPAAYEWVEAALAAVVAVLLGNGIAAQHGSVRIFIV